MIQGISEAPQSISFAAMAERQQALAAVILQDPDVDSLSSFIGVDGTNTTLNSGRILINLKPRDERDASASDDHPPPAARARARSQGITLYMQPVQDLTVDDRGQPHAVPVHASRTPTRTSSHVWVPQLVERLQQLPELRDVASDLQDSGLRPTSRSTATRRRASASRRRRSTTRSTTPSASASSRRSSPSRTSTAWSSKSSRRCQQSLAVARARSTCRRRRRRRAGAAVGDRHGRASRRRRCRSTTSASSRRPRSRSTSRRAPRSARRSTRSTQAQTEIGLPASISTQLPGRGAGLPGLARQRAAADPRRARHGLHRARACSTRATSTRSRSSRPCPRPASARCSR